MIASKYKLIVLLSIAFCHPATAQSLDEDSNWYKEIGRGDYYYSHFDFTRYSKKEIQSAKSKYLQIMADPLQDEWAGSYTRETVLGRANLTWSQRGFVYDYIYHTLANIEYGRVVLRGDSVFLVSERSPVGKRMRFPEGELIRVKFGERHLMVPQSELNDFALAAAGRGIPARVSNEAVYTEDGAVWEKVDDHNKSLAGGLTLPARYAHLVRQPIETKLLSSGKLRIVRKTSSNFALMSGDRVRLLTLSSGSRNGVRVGMSFWIDALEERVEILSVGPTRSVARLVRRFIDGKEFCRNDEGPDLTEPFPCREPKVGMRVRTKTAYF